jgi:hypothetical protein
MGEQLLAIMSNKSTLPATATEATTVPSKAHPISRLTMKYYSSTPTG